MLYPRMNLYRKVFDLSGIWDFKLIQPEEEDEEPAGSLIKNAVPMPVPSSYNDIYPGRKSADHVGKMVYQRKFSVTEDMKEKRLVLRFGSAAHQADVWLNGKHIGSHKGGFLLFSTEEFGFRDITIENCRICLNGKPIYLKGFGKHEEGPFRGRATDTALMTKDMALLKWIGANSFRTSHYPNSEEMLQLCERLGILVIDEAPAVGLNTGFTATGLLGGNPDGTWKEMHTAEHHRTVFRISRLCWESSGRIR